MGLLYGSTPGNTGGFDIPYSGFEGYVNYSQGLPYYSGRSQIASIPEYMRNPWLMADDLVQNIKEGRAPFAKMLYQYAAVNGRVTRPDVKFRWKVTVDPHQRFYLKAAAYTVTANRTTFLLTDYSRPTGAPISSSGNPKVVGNIARLQAGDKILIMFSHVPKDREATSPWYGTAVTQFPIPEIAEVISVDNAANSLVVERNWAGAQRASSADITTTVTVHATTTSHGLSGTVLTKEAFFIKLPNTMPEDEIDQKVWSVTQSWAEGIMQRSMRAWGAGHFQEVINKNLGHGSQYEKNKGMAITKFFEEYEWWAIFGEKSEGWDAETGDWFGTTDGLLAQVPDSHFIGIVPPTYTTIRTRPEKSFGSFDIPIFNKLLEDKGYYGSDTKKMLCGQDAFTAFATTVNYMTQNVPEIRDEWKVVGRRFMSSGGLTVDFILSDTMTLNGMRNKMIMFDPAGFKSVGLANYPTDIIEIQNENPLKSNGFIHGVYAFVDLNPDSTWVFTLDQNLADATLSSYLGYLTGVEHV